MMLFRLCLALGCPHPDYLQLSSRQLNEWYAYYRIHPFGQEHTDWLLAQVSAMVYMANRGKNSRKLKVENFLPLYRKPAATAENVKAAFAKLGARFRGSSGKS